MMATPDNRLVQLGAAFDVTDIKKGSNEAKESIKEMADSITGSAKRAGEQLDQMGGKGSGAAIKLDRAHKAAINNIQIETAAYAAGGRASAEFHRIRAEQRGLDTNILKPYLAELDATKAKTDAVRLATLGGAKGFNEMGMSAKQTTAALRQVPMQFTDIFVSLAGGQAPMTVLMQQGGQLKDIFGGVGAAARAMTNYVVGLISPVTLAAGVVALLGTAYYQANKENQAFNNAIIMTGNMAGVTTGQLHEMAAAIGAGANVTRGEAAAALTEFVTKNAAASDQLERFSGIAVRMQRDAGVAVKTTVDQFAELGKAPLAASIKLNESTGYLTAEVYRQIRALEEQGRTLDAAKLATNTFADALDSRLGQMRQNLGLVERAWEAVWYTAKKAWNAILDVDRAEVDTAEGRLKKTMDRIAELEQLNAPGRGMFAGRSAKQESELKVLQATLAAQQAGVKAAQDASAAEAERTRQVKARAVWDERGIEFMSKAQKMQRELDKARGEGAAAGATAAEMLEREKAIREKYKERGRSGTKDASRFDKASADLDIAKIQASLEKELSVYANYDKELSALRSAGKIGEDEFYGAKLAAIQVRSAIQEAALTSEITRERERKAIGATATERANEQMAIDKKVVELEAKLAKARSDSASEEETTTIARNAALTAVARSYLAAQMAASDYFNETNLGYQREIAALKENDRERALIAGRNQIIDRYAGQRRAVEQQMRLDKEQTDEKRVQYQRQLELLDKFQAASLASWEKYQAALDEVSHDWTVGAQRSLQNYAESTKDVAKSTEEAFTRGMNNMADSIVNMTRTGKLNFSSMAESFISDMLRIKTQELITGPLSMALSGMSIFGGGGGPVDTSVADLGRVFARMAQGGAFASDDLHGHSNSVVSKPTVFSFAKGVGLMGEKPGSPGEAIMPLTRMSDGDLGVKVEGAGGGINITFAPVISIDSRTDQSEVYRIVDKAIRNGNAQLVEQLTRSGKL